MMSTPSVPTAARPPARRGRQWIVRGVILALLILAAVEGLAMWGHQATFKRFESRMADAKRTKTPATLDELPKLAAGWYRQTLHEGGASSLLELTWPAVLQRRQLQIRVDANNRILAYSPEGGLDDQGERTPRKPMPINPGAPAYPAGFLVAHGSDGLSPLVSRRALAREIVRQNFLLTARDQFGVTVCDGVLGETVPKVDGSENWPYSIEVSYPPVLEDKATVVIRRHTPERPVERFRRQVESSTVDLLNELSAAAEGWSQVEFVELLAADGWPRKPALDPNVPPARVPDQARELSMALDPISQFAVLRMLGRALTDAAPSASVVTAMARGYALLGSLTEQHWNASHKVYKARAIVLADQAVRDWPGDAEVWSSRAFVRALCGFHQMALEDLERARKLNAAAAPEWVAAVEAFCQWNTPALTAIDTEFGMYLTLLQAEMYGPDADRIAAGERLWKRNPRCFRAAESLSRMIFLELRAKVSATQNETFAAALPELLLAVPDLPEPARQLRAVRNQPAAVWGDDVPWQAQLVGMLQKTALSPADRHGPSWTVLGRLIEDTLFQQAIAELDLVRNIYSGDTTEAIQQWKKLLPHHPLSPVLAIYDSDAQKARAAVEAVQPILTTREFSDGSTPMLRMLERLRSESDVSLRIRLQRDHVVPDLLVWQNTPAMQSLEFLNPLRRLSPNCPALGVNILEADWDNLEPKARELEEKFANNPEALVKLAQLYESHSMDYEGTARCWLQLSRISTEPQYLFAAAMVMEKQNRLDDQRDVLLRMTTAQIDGLQRAGAAKFLAYWHMNRNEWKEAKPFVDVAAGTGAAWGLTAAADYHEGMGEWDEAEKFQKACSMGYTNTSSGADWYWWCRRTGRGDRAAAKELAETSLQQRASLNGDQRDTKYVRAVFLELEGNLDGALAEHRDLVKGDTADALRSRWMAALIAHKQGNVAERDQLLASLARERQPGCRPHLARVWQTAIRTQQPISDSEACEWLAGLDPDAGEATNNYYFIGQVLLATGNEKLGLDWLNRCASSPQRSKLTSVLACAELVRRGLPLPARRGTEFVTEQQAATWPLHKARNHLSDGRVPQAVTDVEEATRACPDWIAVAAAQAKVQRMSGRSAEAEQAYSALIERTPQIAEFFRGRALARGALNRDPLAVADFTAALALEPENIDLRIDYAWLLATSADDTVRNGAEAVEQARQAFALAPHTGARDSAVLAAALAETGDFEGAVKAQRDVIAKTLIDERQPAQDQLARYQARERYQPPAK